MHRNNLWCQKALEIMEGAHGRLARVVPSPVRAPKLEGYVYRFSEQTVEQAILLKLTRVITGLRAAHLLIDNGFMQEASILQRAIDEAQEDTIFLVYGVFLRKWTELHDKYLKCFWHDDPLSRQTIPRPKIRDYIAEVEAAFGKESADIILKPTKDIYKIYSGYAHSSATNVMELFDGQPPHWQLRGCVGSPFQIDQAYDLRNQYFRGATAHAFAALMFDDISLLQAIMRFADEFMSATELAQFNGPPSSL